MNSTGPPGTCGHRGHREVDPGRWALRELAAPHHEHNIGPPEAHLRDDFTC